MSFRKLNPYLIRCLIFRFEIPQPRVYSIDNRDERIAYYLGAIVQFATKIFARNEVHERFIPFEILIMNFFSFLSVSRLDERYQYFTIR